MAIQPNGFFRNDQQQSVSTTTTQDLFPDLLCEQLDSFSLDDSSPYHIRYPPRGEAVEEERVELSSLLSGKRSRASDDGSTDGRPRCVLFRDGSSSGAVFNLCSATLGAGVLSIPFAFSKAGLIAGLSLLVGSAFVTVLSINFLVRACDATLWKSYEELALRLFGVGAAYLVEFTILIFCFGVCVAYIVAVGDVLQIGVLDPFREDLPGFVTRESAMIAFWGAIMLPLSTLERIDSLRFASFFGVASIWVLVLAVAVRSVRDGFDGGRDVSPTDGAATMSLWPESAWDVLKACPIFMFAFSCQINVPAIYEEMNDATTPRMTRVSWSSVGISGAAYLVIGLFAYSEFGAAVQDNVVKNYCLDRGRPDPTMIFAFVCMTFSIVMAFPLNVLPSRTALDRILRRAESRRRARTEARRTGPADDAPLLRAPASPPSSEATTSTTRRLGLSAAIAGAALATALAVPDVSVVFGVVGGTAAGLTGFVAPAAFALKLKLADGRRAEALAAWALVVGGATVGVLSTVVTVYGFFRDPAVPYACPTDEGF